MKLTHGCGIALFLSATRHFAAADCIGAAIALAET